MHDVGTAWPVGAESLSLLGVVAAYDVVLLYSDSKS